MINHIETYNLLGWATFPVNAKNKKPLAPGWKARTANIFAIAQEADQYLHAGAYGVVLQADDLIIDIDPRNFKDGDNPWKRLRDDLKMPDLGKDAPKVKTGSGGVHIYFKKPAGLDLVPYLKDYPGIDFKAGLKDKGTYVIGPGSGHESGKAYIAMPGAELSDIKPFPSEALPRLLKNLIPKETKGTNKLTGGKQEIRRYTEWLKKFPPAVEGENGDHQTYKAAVKGRDFGLPSEDTLEALTKHYNPKCEPPWSEEVLVTKVNNAYKYANLPAGKEDPALAFKAIKSPTVEWDSETDDKRLWDLDQHGNPKKTLKNAVNYIYTWPEIIGTVKFNSFTGNLEVAKPLPWHKKRTSSNIWEDSDIVLMKYYLAKKLKGVEFSSQMLWEAIQTAGKRHSYHPIRDYVSGIKWDGKKRLDSWLSTYCGTKDDGYTSTIGRKLLIGMVSRIFVPGIKFDYCLILEGAQGIGKSTICAILGGEWYGDVVLDPHARDTIDAIRGKWVIELSEMEVTRRAEAQALKAFISRTTDRTRLAYERTTKDFPRQCVFVGTINPDEMGYLTDTTGNRRFWPVRCEGAFDLEGFRKAKDQILAEAYVAFKGGEELFLSGDVAKMAEIEQNARRHVDPWHDAIADWAEAQSEVTELSMQQVYELVLGGNVKSISRAEQIRIGRILSDMGWRKSRPLRGGSRQHIYSKPTREA